MIGPGRPLGAVVLALLAACSDDDPCAEAPTCLTVEIDSATVDAIDELELDLLYGTFHATTTINTSGASSLPLAAEIILDIGNVPVISVAVVAAGKLNGTLLGTGDANRINVFRGEHPRISISLTPVEPCVSGRLYCGFDLPVGEFDTLYRCNSGGVQTARGFCTAGCVSLPTNDACRAGPLCQDGGRYCGGDKVEGDPQTLYVCMSGVGTMPKVCPSGCVVRPGTDDICR